MPAAKPNRTAPTWNAGSRFYGDHYLAEGTYWLGRRQMGLKTLSDHFQELGADFGEEIERRAADAKLTLETAEKHGVPVEMLWKPADSLPTPEIRREPGNSSSRVADST